MAGEPKIFTKNYINADDTFTVSHGSATISRCYDRDNTSQFISSGANDDTTVVTIEAEFYEGADPVDREFDRLILLNYNLKEWKLQYWTGSAWADITETVFTADTLSNVIISFDAITASKVKLVMTTTKVADEEKKVGQFIVCDLTHEFADDLSDYAENWDETSTDYQLADGTQERAFVKWTDYRLGKYGCKWTTRAVSSAERDLLFAIKEDGNPFLWQPESSQRPYRIFYVHWMSGWAEKYFANFKGTGINVSATFREV